MEYYYDSDYHDSHNEHDPYYYMGENDDNDYEGSDKLTIDQVFYLCLKPTVYETVKSVSSILLWCFIYRLFLRLIKYPCISRHIISFLSGLFSLYLLFSINIFYIVALAIASYFMLWMRKCLQFLKYKNIFLILLPFCYLAICELYVVDSKNWHRIRGSQMIIVMKSISLAFDLDFGKVRQLPSFLEYLGYLLCPGSCIFGPWVSFNDYSLQCEEKFTFKFIQKVVIKLFLAFSFLTVSTCWSEYFIPHTNWKWLAAYRDALSFRTSHYFVSYLSEVTLLLSGYSLATYDGVTKPVKVEFPRSIVNVVIYWNIPMHNWLKVYVFNTTKKFGNFIAVLSTYTVSSLLHGISFQLSAVLLSLGIYSYVEVMLRKKLALAFNACILAKSCKPTCGHRYQKYHPAVLLVNVSLVFLTIFHLAYLGVVFDSSQEEETGYTWEHSLRKWASLNYLSHYIVFLNYIMYFLIK